MTSTLVTTYLGEGLLAARPAAPSITAGSVAVWYSTDTGITSIYDGTAWHNQTSSGVIDLYGPPTAATFSTIVNGGGGSPTPAVSDITNVGMLFNGGVTTSSTSIRAALKNVIASTWTITARLRYNIAPGSFRSGGLCVTDGTKLIRFGMFQNSGWTVQVEYDTNSTTFSSTAAPAGTPQIVSTYEYLRIQNDGTNLLFSISNDGRNWIQVFSAAKGAFLSTITQYGFQIGATQSTGTPAGDTISMLVPYWAETTP